MVVAVFAPDLIDASRIGAAFPHHQRIRSSSKLSSTTADVLIVDLSRPGVLDALVDVNVGRIIGFGPHVDDETLKAAAAVGCEAMARSRFFRSLPELAEDLA